MEKKITNIDDQEQSTKKMECDEVLTESESMSELTENVSLQTATGTEGKPDISTIASKTDSGVEKGLTLASEIPCEKDSINVKRTKRSSAHLKKKSDSPPKKKERLDKDSKNITSPKDTSGLFAEPSPTEKTLLDEPPSKDTKPEMMETGSSSSKDTKPEMMETGSSSSKDTKPEMMETGSSSSKDTKPEMMETGSSSTKDAKPEMMETGSSSTKDKKPEKRRPQWKDMKQISSDDQSSSTATENDSPFLLSEGETTRELESKLTEMMKLAPACSTSTEEESSSAHFEDSQPEQHLDKDSEDITRHKRSSTHFNDSPPKKQRLDKDSENITRHERTGGLFADPSPTEKTLLDEPPSKDTKPEMMETASSSTKEYSPWSPITSTCSNTDVLSKSSTKSSESKENTSENFTSADLNKCRPQLREMKQISSDDQSSDGPFLPSESEPTRVVPQIKVQPASSTSTEEELSNAQDDQTEDDPEERHRVKKSGGIQKSKDENAAN